LKEFLENAFDDFQAIILGMIEMYWTI